jgi:hypothetical protein
MDPSLLQDAQKMWASTFNATPYTSFYQVEYLVKKAGVTYKEFMQDPKILGKRLSKAAIEADRSQDFNYTWASAGRCTSFTIRVARMLQERFDRNNSKYFDFRFYDLKRHRIARCAKTGILIDSSSARGIIVLKNGEWERFDEEGPTMSWKWIDGKSKFERGGALVSPVLIEEFYSEVAFLSNTKL